MWTATGEHWSEEVVRLDDDGPTQRLFYLQLAYVTQVRDEGPWYGWAMGVRVCSRPTKESAMRAVGDWLADNWHKFDWKRAQ